MVPISYKKLKLKHYALVAEFIIYFIAVFMDAYICYLSVILYIAL